MPPFILSRRSDVAAFLAMDVMAAADAEEKAGRRVIHMEIGQPSAATPLSIRRAAGRMLDDGRIAYTHALGVPELRAGIADHYRRRHRLDLAAGRVVVTAGSSGAFSLAFLALFNPGDKVGLPTPAYPAYRNILGALGLEAVPIECGAETRWVATPGLIERAYAEHGLAGLLIASPGNPSGTLIGREDLGRIVEACRALKIRLVSDEIYHGLVYEGEEETALAFGDDMVVVNSFSKYFCMTGWRVGWMVVPEAMVRPLERIAQNLFISVNALSQHAALAALQANEELEAIKAGYAANRAMLLNALPKIGMTEFLPADGAFYIYADVRRFTNDSSEFARRMLTEAGVAATPGADFDTAHGEAFLRFSYAGSMAEMTEAVHRLGNWLGR